MAQISSLFLNVTKQNNHVNRLML